MFGVAMVKKHTNKNTSLRAQNFNTGFNTVVLEKLIMTKLSLAVARLVKPLRQACS